MDYLVSPQNPYIAVLTPDLNIFVNKVFKELNEGKWCPKGGALIQQDPVCSILLWKPQLTHTNQYMEKIFKFIPSSSVDTFRKTDITISLV